MLNNLQKLITFETIDGIQNKDQFDKLFSFVDSLINKSYKRQILTSKSKTSFLWTNSNNPDLLLTAHVDVVPANKNQFFPIIKGDKLYGRGVIDMKFAIAVFVEILKNDFAKNKSIGLLLTSDEEVGGFDGIKYVLEYAKLRPKCVLLPDGGADLSIEQAEKGVLFIRLKALGKTAHGSRPWLGESAIDKIIVAYQLLRKTFPNPKTESWAITINPGKISGGTAFNIISSEATLDLDIRYPTLTERDKVLRTLNNISLQINGLSYEEIIEGLPFEIPKDNIYLINYIKTIISFTGKKPKLIKSAGSSDARFFSKYNIPVIISRPIGGGHHSDSEWISIKSLNLYYEIIKKFVEKF